MAERNIEKDVPVEYFVSTLRRLADALERGERPGCRPGRRVQLI